MNIQIYHSALVLASDILLVYWPTCTHFLPNMYVPITKPRNYQLYLIYVLIFLNDLRKPKKV